MFYRLTSWLSCLLLLSCQPDNTTKTVITEENSDTVDTQQTGDGLLNLGLRGIAVNTETPGPVYITVTLTLEEGSTLLLWLDSEQIINKDIPCRVLPAGTFCDTNKSYSVSFIVEEPGDHTFDIRLSNNTSWSGLAFNHTITQAACQESEQVYQSRMQPELKNNCVSCHGNGNAGTFNANDDWTQMASILNSIGHRFYQVPSGESGHHDGGVRFQQNDGTYRLFAEMVWRAENNFYCSQ